MVDTALIILEYPWWDIDRNPGQASVLPFFQGVERLADNFKVYHATFFDKNSFTEALSGFSLNDRYDRYILYIAAHGSSRKVANMHIGSLCSIVGGFAEVSRIEGVIIGSCHVGVQTQQMKSAMAGSSIAWMMGYKGAVDWLTSTLVDISVINSMLELGGHEITDRDDIFNKFTEAIQRFNPTYPVAHDKKNNQMNLLDTLSLVIQPRGQGHQPKDMTEALQGYEWLEIDGQDN